MIHAVGIMSKATKDGKQLTTDELLAQFDDLNVDASGQPTAAASGEQKDSADPLAELQNLASQRPASRPSTPSKRTSTGTPPRSSEEKTTSRKSGDSSRPYHTSITPAETTGTPSEAEITPQSSGSQSKSNDGGGGGWWGGLFATASAAVKQAEAAVQEIRKNEEAQKWADQVRGNVNSLKGLGMRPIVA